VLIKAGLLPGEANCAATLTNNDSGHYESRWVRMAPASTRSPFVNGADAIELPVGHGEGKFVVSLPGKLHELETAGQIVLRYVDELNRPTQAYPANPNGSQGAVAGLCDPTGRIFGLMPHPDRFTDPLQHPRWTRRGLDKPADGLQIFRNAVNALRG
jgi:phosphoribosylformylglycinamidine synthase